MPWTSERLAKAFEELRESFGGRCQCCHAADQPLEFAHIRPTEVRGRSRGSMHRYYDIRRNPDAYRLLCRRCHRLFDKQGGTILGDQVVPF